MPYCIAHHQMIYSKEGVCLNARQHLANRPNDVDITQTVNASRAVDVLACCYQHDNPDAKLLLLYVSEPYQDVFSTVESVTCRHTMLVYNKRITRYCQQMINELADAKSTHPC
jgi:hypothetical protein